MAIDTTPSQVATNALSAIPFGSIIGGPLKACIEAQAMAAQTSWNFIKEVGLNTDKDTGEKSAVNVTFMFQKDGHMAQLNVPLLTIVPIPYIAITDIDIAFKANISASSSSVSETSSSEAVDAGADIKASVGWGPFKAEASFKANYSSKKDSKATQNSQYSVEYTMDVAVKAGQDSMPAGMAKVLEILSNSLSVENPDGTLEVSSKRIEAVNGEATIIATYKDASGLFKPKEIHTTGEISKAEDGDNMIFTLRPGTYTIEAGKNQVQVVVEGGSESNGGKNSKKNNGE